jgi:hypothetical protein
MYYELLDFSDVIDENEEDKRFEGWVGVCNVRFGFCFDKYIDMRLYDRHTDSDTLTLLII